MGWLGQIVQWTYPPALRIARSTASPDVGALLHMQSRIESLLRNTRGGDPPISTIDPAFVTEFANATFRLRRNVMELRRRGTSFKEVDRIEHVLESLDREFRNQGIECRDLEGQPYDDGRLDFEPIAAQSDPSLAKGIRQIGRCEGPLIILAGRTIQKARGVVHCAETER